MSVILSGLQHGKSVAVTESNQYMDSVYLALSDKDDRVHDVVLSAIEARILARALEELADEAHRKWLAVEG